LSAANGYDQSYAAACRLEIAHFFEILQSGGANGAYKKPPLQMAWRLKSWQMPPQPATKADCR
jgi:hypothetical protein